MKQNGRPRAITKAYRIVANPHDGWLYQGEWWTVEEWRRAEHRRAWMREWKQERGRTALRWSQQAIGQEAA